MKKLYCLILLIAFLATGFTFGQQPNLKIKRITIEEGLSQTVVFSVLQDSEGFLWFGSGSGLNKFNGHSFQIFKQIPGDSTSLSNSHIRVIFEDRDQYLWVGTPDGLNRLIRTEVGENGRPRAVFEHFRHQADDSTSISNSDVWSMMQDETGNLWVGTENGLNVITAEDLAANNIRFRRYVNDKENPNSVPPNRITAIIEDEDGLLWFGSIGGGLGRLNPQTDELKRFRNDKNDPGSLPSNFVMTVFEDHAGTFWLGTYGRGLIRFDRKAETFQSFLPNPSDPFSISEKRVFGITEDDDHFLWIGTFGGGLNRFDPKTGKFYHFKYVSTDEESLSDDFVRKVYQDQSRNLWVTTNGGINMIDLKSRKFVHYRNNPHNSNTLSHNNVLSVWEVNDKDRVELWIGHNEGIDRLDQHTGEYQTYLLEHNNPRGPDGFAYSLCYDHTGTMWAGTFGGGLYRFDFRDEKFTQFTHDPADDNSLGGSRVNDILDDSRGNLWAATTAGGLNLFDRQRESFTKYLHDSEDPASLSDNSITQLLESRDGFLWVGTANGLNHFDPETGRCVRYLHDPADNTSLNANVVKCLYETADGNLWVGTEHGFALLTPADRITGKFTRFLERDGLSNNTVVSIQGDDSGNLWIATYRGLSRFTPDAPAGEQFRNYDAGDGLQSNEFNVSSGFRSASGELFFGGVNGLNRFFPANVQDNPSPPPIAFTAFRRFDEIDLLGRPLQIRKEIQLTHEDRFFGFEFVALDFTNPEKNRYAYKMDGFDKDWIFTGNRRFANYTNLDPGNYTFRVKAANNDGVWNEAGISIPLRISPPFWETWWFRLLVVLIVAAILWALHRYRISKLLEIERVRVRIASDLHDDVGSTLTKIALYSDLIRSGADSNEQNRLLERIGSMSREMVVNMSDIVWSIDARNDSLQDLIDRMRDFASTLFSAKNIDYTFQCEGLEMHKKLPISLRQNIYLIFKEAVNNIAKHAGASQVRVNINRLNGKLVMTISDNGQGLPEATGKSGHGLMNMEMRARRIGGELMLRNGNGVEVELVVKGV